MDVADEVINILTSEENRPFFKEQVQVHAAPSDFDKECLINLQQIVSLIKGVTSLMMKEPMLLQLRSPITICGDLHGQFVDLLWILECCKLPPETSYLFLGDIIDRGPYSIETITLLLAMKIKYPNNFFLLRGNHESNPVNKIYGFMVECATRFNKDLWKSFGELFDWLPVAALIDRKIFCVHGGLSPNLKNVDQILKIPRPITTPLSGMLCDLVWSDPDKAPSGWTANTARDVSYRFGTDVLNDFLKRNKLRLIVRAHEVQRTGYELLDNKLLTVFSAPNYTGTFKNNGAVVKVNNKLECTIIVMSLKKKKVNRLLQTCEKPESIWPQEVAVKKKK